MCMNLIPHAPFAPCPGCSWCIPGSKSASLSSLGKRFSESPGICVSEFTW